MHNKLHPRLRRVRYGIGLLILCAALAPPSEATAHNRGHCVSADLDSPIVLPDGSKHPAGSLTICESRIHSPVAYLHETQINGSKIGMYLSRTFLNEEGVESREPYMIFQRDAHGELVLQEYAVREGQRMRTFLMAYPDRIYTP